MALFTLGCTNTRSTTGDTESSTETEEKVRPRSNEIRGDDISKSRKTSVEEMLQGRAAGVTVTRASGGGFQLRIRGSSTFSGSNDPLIVIDGIPLSRGYGGAIPVNPHDVESIRVLKHAVDMAFYGVRGANGIIVITTKRGGS
jgi:iron complex outermembrane receptor protein